MSKQPLRPPDGARLQALTLAVCIAERTEISEHLQHIRAPAALSLPRRDRPGPRDYQEAAAVHRARAFQVRRTILRNRNVKLGDIAVGVVTALSDHLLPP